MSTVAMDPATRLVRSLDGDYFMLREAAEILGVSHRTLRRLIDEDADRLGPSFCTFFGKVKIYLYTKDDLDRLRAHFDGKRQVFRNTDTPRMNGRPGKWSDQERKALQRLYSRRHYYEKRAEKLEAEQDGRAAQARTKVTQIEGEIAKWQSSKQATD